MYKKGVTLIETVVYLALLSVVSLIFMGSVSYYKSKQKKIAYERELESVKEFIILKTIESSNKKLYNPLGVAKNQIYDKNTKDSVKLSFLEINTGNFLNKEIVIQNGEIKNDFKIILEDDGKVVYEIQSCTRCKKMHI
ncbi:MAG: prepilin-type N-terminal cleavage/methylation domain-containing protein [Sarcina sp.]